MKTASILAAVLFVTFTPCAAIVSSTIFGSILYVDDDAPGDPGPGDPLVSDPLENGSMLRPFDAIQEAVDAAATGDEILIKDGLYTGEGNRAVGLDGINIAIRSLNGPVNCIIDAGDADRVFLFEASNGPDTILEGLLIRNGKADQGAAISCSNDSSPTITGNIFENCWATEHGGAISCSSGATPLIENNLFTGNNAEVNGGCISCDAAAPEILNNRFSGNTATRAAAIHIRNGSAPVIIDNVIINNQTTANGAIYLNESTATIVNCLFAGHQASAIGGAIYCFDSTLTLDFVTIAGNSAFYGGAIGSRSSTITIANSILWGNTSFEIWVSQGSDPMISWSDVRWGYVGEGNIDTDPLFVSGGGIDYCLSQVVAGQISDSPCVDAGSMSAALSCITLPYGERCMDLMNTRSDGGNDVGRVDMGYHRPASFPVSAGLACWPGSGTLPFTCTMLANLGSGSGSQTRRVAGRIDVDLAGGGFIANWRTGWTNLSPGEVFSTSWNQQLPALPSLVGVNCFLLMAEDVTPPPYNQPPYPPAGETDTASCTATGVAP